MPNAHCPSPSTQEAPSLQRLATPRAASSRTSGRRRSYVLRKPNQTKPRIPPSSRHASPRRRRNKPEGRIPATPAKPRGPHRPNHPDAACALPLPIHPGGPVAPTPRRRRAASSRTSGRTRSYSLQKPNQTKPRIAPSPRRASPAAAVINQRRRCPQDPHSPATRMLRPSRSRMRNAPPHPPRRPRRSDASPPQGRIVAHEREEALVRPAQAKPNQAAHPSPLAPRIARRRRKNPTAALPARPAQPRGPC